MREKVIPVDSKKLQLVSMATAMRAVLRKPLDIAERQGLNLMQQEQPKHAPFDHSQIDLGEINWTEPPDKTGEPKVLVGTTNVDGEKVYVMVNNTNLHNEGILTFTESEWDAFLLGVKDGEFAVDEDGNLPPIPEFLQRLSSKTKKIS